MGDGRPTRTPTALVTGASRGIGRGIAIALARAGYDVAITARTVNEGDPTSVAPETGTSLPGSLATTAAEIEAHGVRSVPIVLDLLEVDGLAGAVDAAVDGLGGHLDLLVNNAIYVGTGSDRRFADCDADNLIKRVTGNVTAQLLITQRALLHMIGDVAGPGAPGAPDSAGTATGGTICNITSAAGQTTPRSPVGHGGWPLAYAVTKAGFHRIADMLAVEYGDRGIRSININPGYVATERVVAAGAQLDFVAKYGITPQVIGEAIVSLIGDPDIPNGGYVHAIDRARQLGLVEARR